MRTCTSSQHVRRKFFQKIGIGANRAFNHKHGNTSVDERNTRDLRCMPRFDIPLQYEYDHQEERRREEQRKSRESSDDGNRSSTVPGTTRSKKQVNFQENVTVVAIPMRTEYSARVRAKLFTDAVEMCENAERNLIEFTAENGDWRSACLEDEMYICGVTRELIHPVHVETRAYVFGSGSGFHQSSLSQERQRYWDDGDSI
eukprot:CAMPEP_0183728636 /NCGR_PEP_ID=MMETSP0737-20130205/28571_1 /TAXON_ID=385413 /ORGANISM="Thalassiosira miniscula, Strain CCMP1093" /LENGTH=200 /DNA_ID=CAMNT_0025960637 /DNA_START=265 /DNA_END=867 /DNA_ORIENTATION=-